MIQNNINGMPLARRMPGRPPVLQQRRVDVMVKARGRPAAGRARGRRGLRAWGSPAVRSLRKRLRVPRRAWRHFPGAPGLPASLRGRRTRRAAFGSPSTAIYQVVRKPSELFFPVSGTLNKTPAETWREYGPLFRSYSTEVMTAPLLAALAQVEGSGNPVARTYWRWSLTPAPFDVYRPASSAVGMYQITDGTFREARRLCIRDHRVVEEGPWNDWNSCWFNWLYTRVIPSHAVQLTSAYLDRAVASVLERHAVRGATLARKQELAALIHLCGAGAGDLVREARLAARRGPALRGSRSARLYRAGQCAEAHFRRAHERMMRTALLRRIDRASPCGPRSPPPRARQTRACDGRRPRSCSVGASTLCLHIEAATPARSAAAARLGAALGGHRRAILWPLSGACSCFSISASWTVTGIGGGHTINEGGLCASTSMWDAMPARAADE